MKTSQAGIDLIKAREGVRYREYRDSRGIPTIGVGHTGPEVHDGLVWSEAQVNAALVHDLRWAEDTVSQTIKRPMSQGVFDAFVSIAFNIGAAAFEHSSFARYYNAGMSKPVVASGIRMWNKPSEIQGRRASEISQFMKG